MDRREFLRDATRMLVVLPFATFLIHCDDDDGTTTTVTPTQPADPTPPDAPPRVEGENIVYTSTQTNAHSHSLGIPSANFTAPPPTGVSGGTTEAQFHSHQVVITLAQLQEAAGGQAVKVLTSSNLGHTHVFTIVRVG